LGYTSLLEAAGFRELTFYWPEDGYQKSIPWIDLANKKAVKAAIRKKPWNDIRKSTFSLFASTEMFKYVVPHFGIVARKPG
jgi:hypothetical protein